MRILYINDSLAIWGGLERILVEKMNFLADNYNYDVHIVTADQGDHPIPFLLSPKVSYHDLAIQFHQEYKYHGLKRLYIKGKLRRLYIVRLKEYIEEIKPDVISCVRLYLLGSVLKVKGKIPLIIESHTSCNSYKYEVEGTLKRLREKYYLLQTRKANKIVALTEGDASDWKQYNKNVVVIPNVVHLNDTGRFSDCSSKSAIYIGRFSKQKDIDSLFKIWSLVHRQEPEWQLHIFGGYGDQYEKFMYIVKQLESYNIVVHEPIAQIFDEYLKSSMLLLTSLYEPFGLVLPEAMSCGLPVVAFDCPYGPANIITDGKDGYLIKNRNINDFVEKICKLMNSTTLRKDLGSKGIISSQRFRADKVMPMWKLLFTELTNNIL